MTPYPLIPNSSIFTFNEAKFSVVLPLVSGSALNCTHLAAVSLASMTLY